MTNLADKFSVTPGNLALLIRPLQWRDEAGVFSTSGPAQRVSALLRSCVESRSAGGSPSGRVGGRIFRRALYLYFCLAALGPMDAVMAQAEAAQRTSEEGAAVRPSGKKELPPAMIRGFVVPLEGSNLSLQLGIKPQQPSPVDAPPQVVAATDGPAIFGSNYAPIKPGGVVIELRSGDKVLAGGSVALQPARAYTFVAWQATADGWQLKAFPDDPTTPNAADRAVRVLNFPAGRETLLTIDQRAEIKIPGNAVQEFRAPPKVIVAKVKVLASDGGPPALSSLEMDYSALKSGYIVVVPDNLGRMRPRFIGGGYEEIEELAPSPARASAPVAPLSAEDVRKQRIGTAQMELDSQQMILNMIAAREARMGTKASATLLENKREAEKKLAELKKEVEAARSAAPPPAAP